MLKVIAVHSLKKDGVYHDPEAVVPFEDEKEAARLVKLGAAEWVDGSSGGEEEDEAVDEDESSAVVFASKQARSRASAAGLESEDFEGVEPSSENGYTSDDVKAIVEAPEE